MILPVYTYNHPVLKQRTAQINDMSDELRNLIRDMFETMYKANGIGLAANQVGKGLSLTVIDISDRDEGEEPGQIVMIYPVIEAFSDDEEEFEEGCLSLPDYRDTVIRPSAIQVRYLDASMTERVLEADGLVARVMQHEIDHLNGVLFIDHLSKLKRDRVVKKFTKLAKREP